MKKNALVLFSLFASLDFTAQELASTQGNSCSNASGSINFSRGEVIIA